MRTSKKIQLVSLKSFYIHFGIDSIAMTEVLPTWSVNLTSWQDPMLLIIDVEYGLEYVHRISTKAGDRPVLQCSRSRSL
jgi:hypothetical protein